MQKMIYEVVLRQRKCGGMVSLSRFYMTGEGLLMSNRSYKIEAFVANKD